MQHFFSAPEAVPATHPRRRRKRLRHAPASGCRPSVHARGLGAQAAFSFARAATAADAPAIQPACSPRARPIAARRRRLLGPPRAGSTMPGTEPKARPRQGRSGAKRQQGQKRRRREQSGRRAPPSRSAGVRLDSKRKDPAPLGKGAGPWFRVGTRDGARGLLYRPRTRRASRSRCRFGSPACRRSAPTLAPRFPASSTRYTTGCLPSRRRRSSTRRRGRRD